MLGWLFKILSIHRPGVNRREFLQTTLAAGAALTLPDLLAQAKAAPSEVSTESMLMLKPNLEGVLTKGRKNLPSPVDAFLGEADKVLARMPQLDTLYLSNAGGALFGVPWNLDKLAQSPHLERFKTLFLFKTHAPLSQFQALLKSPHLANLETLVVHQVRLGDLGANAIAGAPALKNLKRLSLWGTDMGPLGMRSLTLSPHLANLQELEFAHNFLGDEGTRFVAAAPHWNRLTDMLLLNNGITAQGARMLAQTQHLAALKNLGLMDQLLGREGEAALVQRFGPLVWLEESEFPEEPFVRAIIADPANEQPRLRYADWLDEQASALAARQAHQATQPPKGQRLEGDRASGHSESEGPGLQKLARLDAAALALAVAQTRASDDEKAPEDKDGPDPRAVRARAALVRVQCDLHGLHPYGPSVQEKWALESNLLSACGDDWGLELGELTWPYSSVRKPTQLVEEFFGLQREKLTFFSFHRGMVEGLECPAEEFLKNGPALFRENPLLAKLNLRAYRDSANTLTRFAASPLLKQLNYLHLFQCDPAKQKTVMESSNLAGVRWLGLQQSEASSDAWKGWLESPRLASVQSLTLRECGFPEPFTLGDCSRLNQVTELDLGNSTFPENGLVNLFRSPHLENVTTLNLAGLQLSDEAMDALVTSPHLQRLQFLNLEGTDCPEDSWGRLGNAPWAQQLLGLNLSATSLQESDIEALAQSPGFTKLQGLNLRQTSLGPDGVRILAKTPWLANLRSLDVGATEMGDDGLAALPESAVLQQLGHLEIHQNEISDAGIAQLAACGWCRSLHSLVVSGNAFGADGTAKIATSSNLGRLRYLSMRNIAMGPAGAKALCRSPALRDLTVLRLAGCQLEDIGATAMAVGNLPNLQVLYLNDNQIGERGAGALARSTPLENLIGLDLQGNEIGEDAAEALREQYGSRVRLKRWSMMNVSVNIF